ncbi:NAD(P)H-dependent oxidoreductase [uncultured Dokdonia sp.]|uniref:NAD(P)H-dependent oxidoreductase n=1 Tax=uncultured Dokdonia sp. TaxID=575653 RepID=UPI002627C60C|nr:NAD(P)H-dependent oxidoreductase [uncultured Dokdonia sp.]
MSQILEALQWRYATKKFDATRHLTAEKVTLIKNAFNLTASSFGLQPVKLLVIHDQKLQDELVPVSMNQQQVSDASHVLVFCIEKNIDKSYIEAYFDNVKKTRDTPDEILKPFRDYLYGHFEKESIEAIENWATKQAYLAMGNLLTICAIEKIDACPMEGFDSESYDALLNLSEKGLSSVLVMPIGYRATDDMFADFKKVRKTLSDAVIEI